MTRSKNPFEDQAIKEVFLPNAPLVRVIAQVRFPMIASVEKAEFVANFQEGIRKKYPFASDEKITNMTIEKKAVNEPPTFREKTETIWRFANSEAKWRVSLSSTFLAIETNAYKHKEDFVERFQEVASLLNKHLAPGQCERVGLRYINRIENQYLDQLSELLNPEVLGPYVPDLNSKVESTFQQSIFSIGEMEKVAARWGLLPPNQTFDPSALDPSSAPSWILDFDMFSEEHTQFDPSRFGSQVLRFNEKIYSLFRWMVTDKFIEVYGGKP